MNELQEVEVTIAPDGRVEVHIQGVKGKACLTITREMEQLLGDEIIDRRHTHEFDEQPQHQAEHEWLRRGDD